jgi:hypothetical protein
MQTGVFLLSWIILSFVFFYPKHTPEHKKIPCAICTRDISSLFSQACTKDTERALGFIRDKDVYGYEDDSESTSDSEKVLPVHSFCLDLWKEFHKKFVKEMDFCEKESTGSCLVKHSEKDHSRESVSSGPEIITSEPCPVCQTDAYHRRYTYTCKSSGKHKLHAFCFFQNLLNTDKGAKCPVCITNDDEIPQYSDFFSDLIVKEKDQANILLSEEAARAISIEEGMGVFLDASFGKFFLSIIGNSRGITFIFLQTLCSFIYLLQTSFGTMYRFMRFLLSYSKIQTTEIGVINYVKKQPSLRPVSLSHELKKSSASRITATLILLTLIFFVLGLNFLIIFSSDFIPYGGYESLITAFIFTLVFSDMKLSFKSFLGTNLDPSYNPIIRFLRVAYLANRHIGIILYTLLFVNYFLPNTGFKDEYMPYTIIICPQMLLAFGLYMSVMTFLNIYFSSPLYYLTLTNIHGSLSFGSIWLTSHVFFGSSDTEPCFVILSVAYSLTWLFLQRSFEERISPGLVHVSMLVTTLYAFHRLNPYSENLKMVIGVWIPLILGSIAIYNSAGKKQEPFSNYRITVENAVEDLRSIITSFSLPKCSNDSLKLIPLLAIIHTILSSMPEQFSGFFVL